MKHRYLALALTAALPLGALAQEPRYTFIEGGYQYLDIDGGGLDVDGDGIGLGGSVGLTDRVHLLGSYSTLDLDFGIDATEYAVGVGGNFPTSDTVHLIGSIGYTSIEVETSAGDADDDGLFLSGGVRWMANEQFELTAELTYVDMDDSGDDTGLSVAGLYNLTPDLAFLLGSSFSDDANGYTAGVRYYFPGPR